jgi:hypothetical protein
MSDYKSILQDLEALNVSKAFPVFIPTHQREVQFLPLTVKQQKNIIKGSLDASTSNAAFNKITNDIIAENSVEDLEYLIIDKVSILTGFRLQCLGSDIRIEDPKDDSIGYDINLQDHYETFKQHAVTPDLLARDITHENISAHIRVPDLNTDSKFTDDTKKSLEFTADDLTETIGKLYVFELAKFLGSITVGDRMIDLKTLSAPESISVIESLPLSVSNDIVKFIESIREFEQKYNTVVIDEKELELPIDATFFNSP